MISSKIQQYFFKPIDNSQIVLFRMLFGLLMLLESFGAIATGWVKKTLIDPQFTFSFLGFEWLQPLPGNGMYFYFVLMGIVSLMVMLGYRYKINIIGLAVLWSGAYFMQKTSYNNHYYLVMLLTWGMVFMNPHHYASLDAKRTKTAIHTCPNWNRLFFVILLLFVFTYGAVAKFYPGWWSGDFIKNSFSHKTNYWLIGPLLGKEWFQQFITFSGVIFDAIIIPLLIWKRTRMLAFIGLVIFNIFNSAVFQIGIFPYTVIALTVFFFKTETIRKLFFPKKQYTHVSGINTKEHNNNTFTSSILIVFFIIQFALPLRHHFIPGDVNWREEGHRMSWRMMLRTKRGAINLEAVNPKTQEKFRIKKREYLTKDQVKELATKPDFLYQFVQRLKKEYAEKGMTDIEIYCKMSRVRLNGNKAKPLFKTDVDLAKVKWNYFGRNEWVLD
ncbi:MAG: HTTM domain-containing protein [Saprospiraceae bacterium]